MKTYLTIIILALSKTGKCADSVVPISQMVEHWLCEREVAGSIIGYAIPKALKFVLVATLLSAQHY